jgi:NADH dehydrogenase
LSEQDLVVWEWPRNWRIDVTLIDRHNYQAFQLLFYQVATSLLNAEDVGVPVRSMFRHQENVTFRMATVTGVDTPSHKYLQGNSKTIALLWQKVAQSARISS